MSPPACHSQSGAGCSDSAGEETDGDGGDDTGRKVGAKSSDKDQTAEWIAIDLLNREPQCRSESEAKQLSPDGDSRAALDGVGNHQQEKTVKSAMPLMLRSRGACSIFLGSVIEAAETVLVNLGPSMLGTLVSLLPDLLGSVSCSSNDEPTVPCHLFPGLLERMVQAHDNAVRAAAAAALEARHYDYLGLERLPNASVSAQFFAEVDDKNRWKTREWLFNNREKKRDEFKKMQKAFETPFSTAEKRAELDRQLQEAVPRFLHGGPEIRSSRDGRSVEHPAVSALALENYAWFVQFFQCELLTSAFTEGDEDVSSQLSRLNSNADKTASLAQRMGGGAAGAGGGSIMSSSSGGNGSGSATVVELRQYDNQLRAGRKGWHAWRK